MGVLLSSNYLLTHGNCSGPLTNATDWTINIRETAKDEVYKFVKPPFLTRSHFGLIKLDKPISGNPICLPKSKISYLHGDNAVYLKSDFKQTVVNIHKSKTC